MTERRHENILPHDRLWADPRLQLFRHGAEAKSQAQLCMLHPDLISFAARPSQLCFSQSDPTCHPRKPRATRIAKLDILGPYSGNRGPLRPGSYREPRQNHREHIRLRFAALMKATKVRRDTRGMPICSRSASHRCDTEVGSLHDRSHAHFSRADFRQTNTRRELRFLGCGMQVLRSDSAPPTSNEKSLISASTASSSLIVGHAVTAGQPAPCAIHRAHAEPRGSAGRAADAFAVHGHVR